MVSCDKCGKKAKNLKRVGKELLCEECYQNLVRDIARDQQAISGSYE